MPPITMWGPRWPVRGHRRQVPEVPPASEVWSPGWGGPIPCRGAEGGACGRRLVFRCPTPETPVGIVAAVMTSVGVSGDADRRASEGHFRAFVFGPGRVTWPCCASASPSVKWG